MDATHLHLLLNHFPVIGTLIGSALLLWGLIRNQPNISAIAATLLTVMAVIAIPVYLTGEPAEETVEKLPGVSESIIEMHENAATIAIWLMGITGITALVSLFFQWQKRKSAKPAFITAFIFSVVCFVTMARAGYYGGQIRHTEIRSSAVQNSGEQEIDKKDKEKDDD